MKRFPFFACLLGLAACAQPLFSQTQCPLHVSGYLSDTREGFPLPYAEIYIEQLGKGIVSDSAGHFHLDNICPGDYVLKCSHISCEPKAFHLHLAGDTTLYWVLVTTDPALEAVSIVGKKTAPVLAPQQQLSVRQMEQQAGKSLGDMLSQLSGVSNLHTGATISKPIIHGLHSSRVVILNNGIRQEGQQWGSEHAPEIDPLLATRLTVVKGASAVRYGSGAIGGVILVEPAPLRDSAGIGGRISLGGFSNGRQGFISGRIGGKLAQIPLAWRVQGTLKRAGNLRTPGYYLSNTGMSEANGSAALAWRELNRGMELFYSQFHTQLGIFSASHLG
ncbi:MAG: TonB-dependent receptor, partial [Bacteroidetes bacterium]